MGLMEFLEKLNGLKRMPRTGWVLCNVASNEVENVAQHTFEVVAITRLLMDEFGRRGGKLDSQRALSMAIMHDWAEAETSDFPHTALKYMETPETKKKIERRAFEGMLDGLSGKQKYLELWDEYNEGRTVEAKLVRAADCFSTLVQIIKYREMGNRSEKLSELWEAICSDLKPYTSEFPFIKELSIELGKRYEKIR